MAKRIGGFRRKTRDKLKKNVREHGKVSICTGELSDVVYRRPDPFLRVEHSDGVSFMEVRVQETRVFIGETGETYEVECEKQET